MHQRTGSKSPGSLSYTPTVFLTCSLESPPVPRGWVRPGRAGKGAEWREPICRAGKAGQAKCPTWPARLSFQKLTTPCTTSPARC